MQVQYIHLTTNADIYGTKEETKMRICGKKVKGRCLKHLYTQCEYIYNTQIHDCCDHVIRQACLPNLTSCR